MSTKHQLAVIQSLQPSLILRPSVIHTTLTVIQQPFSRHLIISLLSSAVMTYCYPSQLTKHPSTRLSAIFYPSSIAPSTETSPSSHVHSLPEIRHTSAGSETPAEVRRRRSTAPILEECRDTVENAPSSQHRGSTETAPRQQKQHRSSTEAAPSGTAAVPQQRLGRVHLRLAV